MTIQELREKRSKAWDTARDFLDSSEMKAVCFRKRTARHTMPWSSRSWHTARKSSGWNDRLRLKRR